MNSIKVFFLIFVVLGCLPKKSNKQRKEDPQNSVSINSVKESWDTKFPSLFAMAYAGTDTKPEQVTYEKFLNDLKKNN